jgi:glycosyltransferase involved in cell wall biosynthesis
MRLLFVGNMDFFPNKFGVLHFVESIFPVIKKRIPSVELNIVGLCKDQDYKSKLSAVCGVNVLGFVDHLREDYQNCRAIIVPLYHGAGTSIKFIEGIMMNRPIVATPMGARGFDSIFKANQHYLLANNDREFADHVVHVLSDPDKASAMAREACGIGKEHFSKESFFDVVRKSIRYVSAG